MLRRSYWVLGLLLLSCGGPRDAGSEVAPAQRQVEWVLAIHGGAGVIPAELTTSERQATLDSLGAALRIGAGLLERGESSLDAVEQVLRALEDDPRFNAGKGAVFHHEGGHELDAAIVSGRDLACGAVAGVTTVKNPISLARRVMERTPHVLLAGAGADAFAAEQGVEQVAQEYFFTQRRWEALERARRREAAEASAGTVGAVALDRRGDLAAGTSTGGLTNKRLGRIGDSPIIGAGTFADNRSCAVSASGKGEEFIRHGVAQKIAALMELGGLSLHEAVERVVHERLRPGDGGVIALSAAGEIAMDFNTEGMLRGAADSAGRFEVHIGRDSR